MAVCQHAAQHRQLQLQLHASGGHLENPLLTCCIMHAAHRYSIAADLVGELLPDIRAAAAEAPASLLWPPQQSHNQNNDAAWRGGGALAGLVAVAVWLRLSSLRLLVWNHNYNVKPREISAALDTLGARLIEVRGGSWFNVKITQY